MVEAERSFFSYILGLENSDFWRFCHPFSHLFSIFLYTWAFSMGLECFHTGVRFKPDKSTWLFGILIAVIS